MEQIKIIPLKSVSFSKKPSAAAINNQAYNEHTDVYFKCDTILKLAGQYSLKVSNYIFQYCTSILT